MIKKYINDITDSANTAVPKYEVSSEFCIAIEDIFEVFIPIDSISCYNDRCSSDGKHKLIKKEADRIRYKWQWERAYRDWRDIYETLQECISCDGAILDVKVDDIYDSNESYYDKDSKVYMLDL